jgi:biopolymer transport protein ExbB
MLELFLKGGLMMYPLLLCSLAAMIVVIERAYFWWRNREAGGACNAVLALLEANRDKEAHQQAEKGGLVGRVLAVGIEHANPSLVTAMQAATTVEISRMKAGLPVLDTVVTLAPLLGLLGTIIGMVQSFQIMAVSGLGQPHAVTGGVAEALIATATGLVVAIVALIPHNYFAARIERTTDRIEEYATRLELAFRAREARDAHS